MKKYCVQLSLAVVVVLAGVVLRRAVAASSSELTGWASLTVGIGCSPLPQMAEQPASDRSAAPVSTVSSIELRPSPSFGTSPLPLPPPHFVALKTSQTLEPGSFGTSPLPLPPPHVVATEPSQAEPLLSFGTSPMPLPPPGVRLV
jgi:hypothetical protein